MQKEQKKILFTGYRAADIDRIDDKGRAVFHVLDIYHKHAIEKVHPGLEVVCSAHLPDGDWERISMLTGPKLMSGELSLDLFQECHRFGCKVELDFRGTERDRNSLLDKVKSKPSRVRSFKSIWTASVPGGPKLEFASYPGCFCHRRFDEGGLALAEVASREIAALKGGALKLLDMGCGCGLVGFLIKSTAPFVELTMVDSHTRAVEAAKENSARFAMPAEVVLSDNGISGTEFDVFVGNPPYYSDYRIADVFLQTAAETLKKGGVCYTVCKNAAGLEPVQRRYFGDVTVISRRSYAVLKSIKRS